jgi:hypothetical protein
VRSRPIIGPAPRLRSRSSPACSPRHPAW